MRPGWGQAFHAVWNRSGSARLATLGLSVALAYYAGARLGFLLVFPGSPLSIIWPPNAIVLAALLLVPPRTWWIVVLGVLPAHLVVEWQSGVLPLAVPGLYVTNCGEALLGAALVRRFSGGGAPWLGTLQQVVVYVVGAAIAAPFVASFLDTGVVVATHWAAPRDYWLLWEERFVSAVLTNLTVAPVILLLACGLASGSWRQWRTLPRRRVVEAVLLALSLLGISYVAFSVPTAIPQNMPDLLYLLVPVLLWAAVRFGVGGISASLLAVACLAAGWADASGIFVARTPAAAVVTLQLFLIALGAPALGLAGLVQERERDAAVLRASQEQYRAVVEMQTELITRYRPDLTITFVNDATCRFMGRTREELLGTPLDADLDAEASARVRELVHALLARPDLGTLTIEHETPHRDGTRHWQQWNNRVIVDAAGRVVELQGIGRDVTERKQLEHEREAARVQAERQAEQLDRIVEGMGEGLFVYDAEGRIVRTNATARRLLGLDAAPPDFYDLPAEERIARYAPHEGITPLLQLLSPQQWLARRAERDADVLRQPEARDVHMRSLDGRELEVGANVAPLCDRDGQVVGAVLLLSDRTVLRRMESEREQAEARELAAQEVARQLDQFFAIASHDIRSPVTALGGFIQVAQLRVQVLQAALAARAEPDAALVTPLLQTLASADESGARLQRLVTLLFDAARARSGTLILTLAPSDLVAVVREQVAAQQSATPTRVIELEVPEQPVLVDGDADRLVQVLTNYLTNAVKYSADDHPIAVRVSRTADTATVAVQDHGPGLPEDEHHHVWEPSYRAPGVPVQSTASGAAGSLGMGLYVCKSLIELHPGGQVGVDSVVGEGSTFWFSLPLAPAEA
jgi:PAS domain S-box-containing protein